MHNMGDWELLQAYAKDRSETAFTELVQRHLHWVYSAALRQLGDPHLAKDVAQSVFILLARKAGSLSSGTILAGWLFRTTRFVAARAMRSEYRRNAREQTASAMISTISPDDNETLWNQLAPQLDQAVAALSETDRLAILLRFYEQKPLRDVGERLGMSEEAAKKRVSRAIEKMRKFLTRRGVVLAGSGLIAILAEQTVQAAPDALLAAVVKTSVASSSASAVLPQLARETLSAWRWAKLKLFGSIAAVSVAGVAVTIQTAPWRTHSQTTRSSIDKSVAVRVEAPSSATQATPPPSTNPAVTDNTTPKRIIDVLVMDAKTKQPMPGVKIGAMEYQKKEITGETDETGHYQIRLPVKEPGYLGVRAHKAGFVPLRVDWHAHRGADPLPNEFTFAMEPATPIGGIVRDEQGGPIAGVAVTLGFKAWPTDNRVCIDSKGFDKVATDAQGRWRFDQAPADLRAISIRLNHPDYSEDYHPGPEPARSLEEQLRDMSAVFVMKKGLVVAGVVLDQQGRPVGGASVGLGENMYNVAFLKTTTDAMGAFRFNNATGGQTLLNVQAHGYAPAMKQIDAGEDTSSIEFRLEPGHVVRGKVIDVQGNPIAGVSVSPGNWRGHQLLKWDTETGANGVFEWLDTPEDVIHLDFLREGYRRSGADTRPDSSENLIVTLKPPFVARGSVTDAETGAPIPSFKITVGSVTDGMPEPQWDWDRQHHRSFSAGEYEYSLESVYSLQPVGRYVLRAEADGYAPEISPEFDSENEGLTQDFKLTRTAWIQGVVYSPDHRPLADADVFLLKPHQQAMVENGHMFIQNQALNVRTGEDGRFKFPPAPGPYLLLALHKQGCGQVASQSDGTLPDLIIEPWARVEGEVFIGAQPAVAKSVGLHREGYSWERTEKPWVHFQANATTDGTGHFVIDYVPAGKVAVGLWLPVNSQPKTSTLTHSVLLPTEPGQTTHVKIGGTGQPVIGRLTVPAEFQSQIDWPKLAPRITTVIPQSKFPAQWSTMTREEKNQWYLVEMHAYPMSISADGSFRVEDVPSGAYEVQISLTESVSNNVSIVRHSFRREFTAPELPNGRSDEPLDLGDFELQPIQFPK
jgi:RNA polymerase sigma factor (sigma-70 family)